MGKSEPPSNAEWLVWGESDPFWGVASWPGRERNGANPWTPDEFYALGKLDWTAFERRLTRYGAYFGSGLEIGCGAGRLTRHMADDFASVIDVDVSEGMLQTARRHIGASNVDLRLGDGVTFPVESASMDVVVSTHVFQHFDSLKVASANLHEIHRVLRPRGATLIHLPVINPPERLARFTALFMWSMKRVGDLQAQYRRRLGIPMMRGLEYPWSWIASQLQQVGFVEIELQRFSVQSNGGVHDCILARRE